MGGNPYPVSLRKKMIEESLSAEKIPPQKYEIIEIPDIHDDDKWVSHVEKLVPEFGDVYSGTKKVQDLFEKNGKHAVRVPKFNIKISATEIREKMAGRLPWEDFVPPAVAEIIKNYGN